MLKSKRGIAIESAIVFIVVIFSFCSLITTYTLMGHYKVTGDNFEINNRAELDQIGEDFIYNLEEYQSKLGGEAPIDFPTVPQKEGYVINIEAEGDSAAANPEDVPTADESEDELDDAPEEEPSENDREIQYYVLTVYKNDVLKLTVKATFDESGNVKLIYWK